MAGSHSSINHIQLDQVYKRKPSLKISLAEKR
jgi:hypothetical protein